MPAASQLLSRRNVGMALVVLSAVSYGCNPMLVKVALGNRAGIASLLAIRYGIAAICLAALMIALREPLPRGRNLAWLVWLGGFGNMGHSGLYFLALSRSSASSVAIILFIYPAVVTLIAAAFLKERVPLLKWVAVIMALSGAMMAVGKPTGATTLGSIYAVAAATWYAAYIVVSSRITARSTTLASTTLVVASSAFVFCVVALVAGFRPPAAPVGWAAALGTAIVGTVIAILSFFGGLSRVGPVTTSTVGTLEPITAVLLATAILREHMTPLQIAGGLLVMGAVYLLSRTEARPEKLPALDT